MKTNPFFSFFKKPVIIGCSIALVLLLITAQFAYQRYLIQKAEQTKELNREAQDVKEKLQTALNHSLSATKTLSLLVTRYNGERDFDTVAKSILESNKYIDGLELVRAGVITKIYPLQGNEQALGYNILEDTLRNKEAIRAINDNELFFAGPIQLRQGYPAVVGRLPITEQGKFWGFAAVIIKLSTFIKAAEIDSAHNPGFIYQLSKIDPNTGKEVFFLPHAEFFQQGQQVVSTKVSKGNWIIYVRSADSRWPVTLLPIIILGVLLSASGGLLAWYITRQPETLKTLVQEKTTELRKSEEKYFSFFEQASDAIWVADYSGRIVEVNNNLCQLLGYTKEELLKKNVSDLIKESIITGKPETVELVKTNNQVIREKELLKQNGETVHVEANVKTIADDRVMTIARDITELRKVQKQITLSESTLRSAFEYSAIGMGLVSPEGRWLRVNPAICRLLGYSEQEMLAKGFQEMTYPEDLARDVEFMQQVFKGQKESRKTQKRYVHKNGAVIWVNLNVSVVRGSERKPLFFVVQLEDVTEKRESEQMFRDLVEKSLVGVYIVQNGKFAYVNPRFAEIYGYKQEELINTISAEMVVHEQDRPKALEKIRQRISGEEQSQHYEAIGQRKDGQQIFVEAYGSSTIYRGQPAIIGTVLDITERKKADAELIDSEERKRILVNSALDAIVSSDENGIIISWNPQAEKLFGWTEKEITGKRLTDTIIPRQYHERHSKGMAHYHQTGEGPILHKLIEVTAVDRQGREFIAELTVIPIIQNGKTTFTAFLRDISKRKQAEQEVTKLNRLYKFISEINESVLKLDNSEAIHREACRIAVEHGKFRMAWIGLYREQEKEVIPVASAGYEDGYLQQVKITAKGNVPEGMGPTGRALRTGKLYYCNDVANDPVMLPWRTEALKRDYRSSMSIPIVVNGRVYGVYTLYMPESNFFNESEIKLLQEVTDNIAYALDKIRIAAMHRAATNELQESEGKFRSLVEQSFVGVFILQDGKLSYVNPGFEKIFGYTREKLVPSMRLENLIHETDLESLKRNDFVRIKRKGAKSQNVVRAIRSDGAILYIDIIASSIHYQQRPAIIGTVIDITDQLEEEKRISKAVTEAQENERIQIGMELHDNVKQLLAASLLHLDYVKTHITDTTMVVTTIDHLKAYIREAIDELRRLSHQLAPSVDATVPLSEKVQDLVSNLNLAGQVKVTLQLEEITVPVSTAVQLALYRILQEQFSNILKHAQARHVFISLKNEGESIVLIIRDDGSGFDTSVKKEGIGLVNIRRRATMLNGQVSIISSPGYGCEVQVHIPL